VPSETPEEEKAGGDAATGASPVAAAQLYDHDQLSEQEITERLGAVRAGLVDALVTDAATAQATIEQLRNAP
jgi:hypothetical protein